MVDLQEYEDYFVDVSETIGGIGKMIPITYDMDINEHIQCLKKEDLPVLFVVLPTAETESANPDAVIEINFGMCLLLDKLDKQRERTLDVQKRLQPAFEKLKNAMREEYGRCGIFGRIDLSSMTSVPESGLFSVMSGWSLGFKFSSE